MFVNQSSLPHLLLPEHYVSENQYRLEMERLFRPSWQWVGNECDLRNDGDFVTFDLWDTPVLLRNFGGHFRGFLNVCPHRHSMLRNERQGNQPTLKCQYHGWEFGVTGQSKKIPGAQYFRPFSEGPACLKSINHEVVGPLAFASLDSAPADLRRRLNPFHHVLEEFEAARWEHHSTWNYDFDANWKVIVENTIESYHLDTVHTHSFRFEPEEQIEHEILEHGAVMRASTRTGRLWEFASKAVGSFLEPGSSSKYRIHHFFPNLFLIRIGVILQVMVVLPVSPSKSHVRVSLFVIRKSKPSPISQLVTKGWGGVMQRAIKQILYEDARLYPSLQKGVTHSPFRGAIGTREELVHAFQEYVIHATRKPK